MGETITVTSQAELIAALGKAAGGETILLAPGDYGTLQLAARTKININYASEVTITSADPENPAVFKGLDLRGVSNLTFDSVKFDYLSVEGAPLWNKPFQIVDSANITIRNSTFDGDLARGVDATSDGYATGFALSVGNSQNITIENNEAFNFYRGFVFGGTDNLIVKGNDLHSLSLDGMNFVSVQKVLIEDNYIHDFVLAPNSSGHADMIQFWTNGTTRPSTDIVIRNNVLDIGDGSRTQSIFMRNDMVDRGLAGPEMFYQNITIEGNVIVNAHSHGITVGETAGLIIRNNSVLHADGDTPDGADASVEIPKINVKSASTDVTITQNATAAITGYTNQTDWTVRLNAFVQDQDPLGPGWYGDVFIASSLDTTKGVHNFFALPGGMLDILGAGAPATLNPAAGALFHITGPQFSDHINIFDATVMGPQPAGTTYLWDFGDGTNASGATVAHAFANGGRYSVTLSVQSPDGKTTSTTLNMPVANAELVKLDASGAFVVSILGEEALLSTVATSEGLQLGAPGVTASVARAHIAPMLGSTSATITLTLNADVAGTAGEVMRLHGSFILSVDQAGDVILQAWQTTGQAVTLKATGGKVNDTAPHSVEIRLEGGTLALWVDGNLATETAFVGNFLNSGTHSLVFGNPWGKTNFNGDLTEFSIRLNGDSDNLPPTAEPILLPEPIPAPAPDPEPEPEATTPTDPEPEPISAPAPEPEPVVTTPTGPEPEPILLPEPEVEEPAPVQTEPTPAPIVEEPARFKFFDKVWKNDPAGIFKKLISEPDDQTTVKTDSSTSFAQFQRTQDSSDDIFSKFFSMDANGPLL